MGKKLPLITRFDAYVGDIIDNPRKLLFDITWKFRKVSGPLKFLTNVSILSALILAPTHLHLIPDPYKTMTPKQAIEAVSTFKQAENYNLRHLAYWEVNKPGAPFEEIHKKRFGVCRDGATASIALLSDDPNYEVSTMFLNSRYADTVLNKGLLTYLFNNHEVALVLDKETGKYGSLGINRLDCIKPTLNSPKAVFDKINSTFFGQFTSFEIYKRN